MMPNILNILLFYETLTANQPIIWQFLFRRFHHIGSYINTADEHILPIEQADEIERDFGIGTFKAYLINLRGSDDGWSNDARISLVFGTGRRMRGLDGSRCRLWSGDCGCF
jgi:hypothetical protein